MDSVKRPRTNSPSADFAEMVRGIEAATPQPKARITAAASEV
jgi:hypothetical protein